MFFASISDIHIRPLVDDPGFRTWKSFQVHPLVHSATHIGLLGDIFDLMAGDHPEYLSIHADFFKTVHGWCESGKVVFISEGNHDMHIKRLLHRLTQDWSPAARARLVHVKNSLLLEGPSGNIWLGHGDKFNRDDLAYLRYMKFIHTRFWEWFADFVMPLTLLNAIGERASRHSRAYGGKVFDEEKIRQRFRAGVETMTPPEAQFVVGGHSHVMDIHHWNGKTYLNNGFPPRSRKFVFIDEKGARLEDLSK